MSPQPPTTETSLAKEQEAKRASLKIDAAFEAAARLAGSDVPPAEFHQEFLKIVLAGIDAPAGAIWLRTPQGFLQLQCHINIEHVGLDKHKGGRQSHNELLRQAFQMGKKMLLEPYGQSGILEGIPAGNPTEFFCLIAAILVEKEIAGLVEVWQNPRWDSRVQRQCLNYLEQMAGYAATYTRNQQGRKLVGQEQLWSQVESFAREIHSSLDATRVAYHVVNEARRLIGCDRVSVACVFDRKAKIVAVSGSDVVEKRSNLILLMRTLCDAVLAWGERLVHSGTKDDSLPPDVLAALDDYLAESNSKFLVLQPLRDDRQKDMPSPTRSAILMECFEPPESTEPLIARMEVINRHATSALYNAVEWKRIPLRWLWYPVYRVQQGLGGKTKTILWTILAALTIFTVMMIFVPYPLKLEANGKLLPKERQLVYANHDGTVRQFLIEPNHTFGPHHKLALMYNAELAQQLNVIDQEIRTSNEKVQHVTGLINESKDLMTKGKYLLERITAAATLQAKLKQRETLIKINNGDPNRPGYFWVQSPQFAGIDVVDGHTPIWTVLDTDFRENHLNKYVRPDQPILRSGDQKGRWELRLSIPQKHIGQVMSAFDKTKPESEQFLWVDVLVTSEPTTVYKGILYRSNIAGEAVPSKDSHNEATPEVTAYVSLDDPKIAKGDRVPSNLLVTEVEVHGKVRCNNHRMGYSLFYGVWEFIYEKVVFFF